MFLSTELLSYSVWRVSILKHKATLCFEVAHLLQWCVCGSASLPTLCISRHFNGYKSMKVKWYIIMIFKVYLPDYKWDWILYVYLPYVVSFLWDAFLCLLPVFLLDYLLYSHWVQGVFKVYHERYFFDGYMCYRYLLPVFGISFSLSLYTFFEKSTLLSYNWHNKLHIFKMPN